MAAGAERVRAPRRRGAVPRGRRGVPPGADRRRRATAPLGNIAERGPRRRSLVARRPLARPRVPAGARAARSTAGSSRRSRPATPAEARAAMCAHLDTVEGYLAERVRAAPRRASRARMDADRRREAAGDRGARHAGWTTTADGPRHSAARLRAAAALRRRLRAEARRARPSREVRRLVVGDAVGAIVSTDPFDADVLARRPSLRVVARVGVGTDSIDLDAATERGRRRHGHARAPTRPRSPTTRSR